MINDGLKSLFHLAVTRNCGWDFVCYGGNGYLGYYEWMENLGVPDSADDMCVDSVDSADSTEGRESCNVMKRCYRPLALGTTGTC